jgi:hypothetical protein
MRRKQKCGEEDVVAYVPLPRTKTRSHMFTFSIPVQPHQSSDLAPVRHPGRPKCCLTRDGRGRGGEMLLQIAFGVTGEMKSNHGDNWRRGAERRSEKQEATRQKVGVFKSPSSSSLLLSHL